MLHHQAQSQIKLLNDTFYILKMLEI
jgi:hypothetical protein